MQLTYPWRWTLASRSQPHDFGRLDYSTKTHVFVVDQSSTVKEIDRLNRLAFFRELVHRGLCTGSRLTRTSCTVSLYCTVVLYRRPPVVLFAVRVLLALAGSCWLLLAHNVRSQLYCCTVRAWRTRETGQTIPPLYLPWSVAGVEFVYRAIGSK